MFLSFNKQTIFVYKLAAIMPSKFASMFIHNTVKAYNKPGGKAL